MGPEEIIKKLISENISIFAIADHNSTKNCEAFLKVAKKYNIRCIPAVEVTTTEEAHVLCYFDSLRTFTGVSVIQL